MTDRAKRNLERGRVRGVTLVMIAVAALLIIVGWMVFTQIRDRNANSPMAVADNFVTLLADKNTDDSYALLDKAFKDSSPKDTWDTWVNFAFENVDGQPTFVKELKVQDPSKVYEKGVLPVRYVYSFTVEGKKYTADFVLAEENGTWKISEIGALVE